MADRILFNLTEDVIHGWQAQKNNLEREIADKQAQLSAVTQKLQAAAILTAEQPMLAVDRDQEHRPNAAGPDPENMTEAIATIANTSTQPLSPGSIKQRLRTLGYPENRLQNYFYTVIARLKTKGRISVTEDGKLWKAAA